MRSGLGRWVVLLAALAACCVLWGPALAGAAPATASPCGDSVAPTGWMQATDWSDLSSDAENAMAGTPVSIYLNAGAPGASITAPAGDALDIPQGTSVTLDLCGDNLTIQSPPANDAAISVPAAGGPVAAASFTIEDTSSSVLDDQGTVTVDGGPDYDCAEIDSVYTCNAGFGVGAGAGIGGDDQQSSGNVTILGGNVFAEGGDTNSYSGQKLGGAGAGIGGGGADAASVANGGSGASGGGGGTVDLLGGYVDAVGGDPDEPGYGSIGGAGAGIGGGGGGFGTTSGGGAALELAGASVFVGGGAPTGATPPATGCAHPSECGLAAAGIGPGGDGTGGATATGTDGTVTVAAGSSGDAVSQLWGSAQDPLTVNAGATLDVPDRETLELDTSADTNDGTIELDGELDGSATLDNAGVIRLTSDGLLDGDGLGGADEVTVSGNIYDVTFALPAGSTGTAPGSKWVYAPTFAKDDLLLPSIPVKAGYVAQWVSGGKAVTGTSVLAPFSSTVADVPTVALTEKYALGKLTVKIVGAKNGKTYEKAPKLKCEAVLAAPGKASCKLSVKKKHVKHGYTETATASAKGPAGQKASAEIHFTVHKS